MKARTRHVAGVSRVAQAALERRLAAYQARGVPLTPTLHLFGDAQGRRYRDPMGAADPDGQPGWPAPTYWRTCLRRAGLPGGRYRLHDFRAEAAARLYERTKDLLKVKRFLHHADLAQTVRYLAALLGEAQEFAAIMDAAEQGTPAGAQVHGPA